MKRLLCLSALIVYLFACCPSSATKPATPIAHTATLQPTAVPSQPTHTPTPLPAPTETPLPTDTPAPSQPTAKVTAPTLNVRTGPGTAYPTVGQLSLDDSVQVVGRNAASDWLQIVYPPDSDGTAWIAADYAELTGSMTALPEVSAPPPPEPTPPPTDTLASPEPSPVQANVVIVAVNKRQEYVDIQNTGGAPQDLTGWHLLSEKGPQDCPLGGTIQPGETLRIWAMAQDADKGGYNCGFDANIWNNDEVDPAVLYDATGREVDRK